MNPDFYLKLLSLMFIIRTISPSPETYDILSREKRFLIWKEGINWVQMVLGIGLPIELEDETVTVGTALKAFYLLPTNSSAYTHPMVETYRKKRSPIRWAAYNLIERYLENNGHGDGKACLLKAICEVASVPFDEKSGILTEIVHALLTPSSTVELFDNQVNSIYHAAEKKGRNSGVKCDMLFPECIPNFVEKFSRFL